MGWASTTTDSDGFYELNGLEPDDYRLMFEPDDGPLQFAFGQREWDDADLIPVGAGEVVDGR